MRNYYGLVSEEYNDTWGIFYHNWIVTARHVYLYALQDLKEALKKKTVSVKEVNKLHKVVLKRRNEYNRIKREASETDRTR